MKGFPKDRVFERSVQAVPFDDLRSFAVRWEYREEDFTSFAHAIGRPKSQKIFDAFLALRLLAPTANDTLLDASGTTGSMFLSWANMTTECRDLYLLDSGASPRPAYPRCVRPALGYPEVIPLPPQSVSRVALLRTLEHLTEERDKGTMRELGRLLRPKGRAVLLPLLLGEPYTELWRSQPARPKCDERARTIVDPDSTILGQNEPFARIYSASALLRRLFQSATDAGLRPLVYEIGRGDGDAPLYGGYRGTKLIRPVRALVLEKVRDDFS